MESTVLLARMTGAIFEAMGCIRAAQLSAPDGEVEIKADATLVTPTDKQSEAIFHHHLGAIPGMKFMGEEGTASGDGDDTMLADPLDGTRPFALRLATSVDIAAVVNTAGRVTHCVIGDPATGRIWAAAHDVPTYARVIDFPTGVMLSHRTVRVWDGPLSEQASLFLDASNGFVRSKRQIMTDEQVRNLLVNMARRGRLCMTGSNGQHFALIANGGEYAAGLITTAMGGPWDVAGALLVTQAGGCVRSFKMLPEGVPVTLADPLNIMAADIVIAANSPDTAQRLVDLLHASL